MAQDENLFSFLDKDSEPRPAEAEPKRKRGALPREGTPDESGYTAASIEVLEGLEPVRRRPGMYIGGTDESGLNHLFAEVLDNAMDEAVAGHASFIDVTLEESGFCTVVDNGRGIPIDPHPKFPGRSALEVIMTDAACGREVRFGRLRDLRRPARRRRLGGQRAVRSAGGRGGATARRSTARCSRAEPRSGRSRRSAGCRTGAAPRCGSGRTRTSSAPVLRLDPLRLFRMARSKAYLFGGVEDPLATARRRFWTAAQVPAEAVFRFPNGPARPSGWPRPRAAASSPNSPSSVGSPSRARHGSVEWAVAWTSDDDGFMQSYCNTIPTPKGGTHETGLRNALLRGLKDHAERIGQSRRAAAVTADDVMLNCAALLSVFIREPEFQGQTKGRLQTLEATSDRRRRGARRLRPLARRLPVPGRAAARLEHRAGGGAAAAQVRKGGRAQIRHPQAAPAR